MFLQPARERIFNVPIVVLAMGALMGLVHAVSRASPDGAADERVLADFRFHSGPVRAKRAGDEPWTTGWGAAVWTFFSYTFIHSDLNHLFFNLVWLLAFGTAVARRFGTLRFIVFFFVTAAAGAQPIFTHLGELVPVVGASAGISGAMGAVLRFVFGGGSISISRLAGRAALRARQPCP
jgi:membrane associated rhomboid family serine protease